MNTRTFFMTILLSMIVSGCSARSRDDHTYVVVREGDPVQILDNADGKATPVKILGTTVKTKEKAKQDVSGWIAMPPDHWEAIKKDLDAKHPEAQTPTKP